MQQLTTEEYKRTLTAALTDQRARDLLDAHRAAVAAARDAVKALDIRPGTRRVPGGRDGREWRYVGLVRRGRTVLAECGHEHTNRDHSSRTGGTSAAGCARQIIDGATVHSTSLTNAARFREAWQSLTRSTGFTHPKTAIEAAKTAAARDAAAYLAAVETVRAQWTTPAPAPTS